MRPSATRTRAWLGMDIGDLLEFSPPANASAVTRVPSLAVPAGPSGRDLRRRPRRRSGAISPSTSISSSSLSSILATLTTCSFSATRKIVTPCVLRPMTRMSPTVVRMILRLVGDQHQLLARRHREAGDDAAVAFRRVDVGDALAAAVGAAILIGRCCACRSRFRSRSAGTAPSPQARHSARREACTPRPSRATPGI